MLTQSDAKALEQEIPYLRRFACARVGDRDYADDLVQACLEKAIRNFDKYQQGTNLRAWLITILRNHQISEYRKVKRRPEQVSFDLITYAGSQAETQSGAIEFQQFSKLFYSLPEMDQEILMLVAVEGLKYEEAADVLDIAIGTVRSRLSRARSKLRKLEEASEASVNTGSEKSREQRNRAFRHAGYSPKLAFA